MGEVFTCTLLVAVVAGMLSLEIMVRRIPVEIGHRSMKRFSGEVAAATQNGNFRLDGVAGRFDGGLLVFGDTPAVLDSRDTRELEDPVADAALPSLLMARVVIAYS